MMGAALLEASTQTMDLLVHLTVCNELLPSQSRWATGKAKLRQNWMQSKTHLSSILQIDALFRFICL
jgi:hypothetical protein